MPKPLSIDLRERVLAAVAGGMSRRAAAERFGVAPSTAIKWVATWRANGRDRPLTAGGDRRSHPIETHAEAILAWLDRHPRIVRRVITREGEGRIEHRLHVVQIGDRFAAPMRCSSSAMNSLRSRKRVSTVRRSWLMAASIIVRSSTR